MSKFEEYGFYSDNRDFLSTDGIIAFNNSAGKLMALKPDITLSKMPAPYLILKRVIITTKMFTA